MLTMPWRVLGHPVTPDAGLALPPTVLAAWGVLALAVIVLRPRTATSHEPVPIRDDVLGPPALATRALALALVVLCIAAGLAGDEGLRNLAPPLVLGVAWPGLLLLSAVAGPVWRWIDPWDSTARLLRPLLGSEPAPPVDGDVRLAVLGALAWTWYLGFHPDPATPRAVGTALAAYTAVTLAGCVALGRRGWLERAEVFGILLRWVAALPRMRLAAWAPPRGAEAVLGVVLGGLLVGRARTSAELVDAVPLLISAPSVVVFAVATGGGALIATRTASTARRLGAEGSVAAALVPGAALTALALVLRRFLVSLQVLPFVAADPFGTGDPLWSLGYGIDLNPLGNTGGAVVEVALIFLGHLLGALVLRRRAPTWRTRRPAAWALFTSLAAALLVTASR